MNLNFKNNKFGVNAIRKLALAALAGVAVSVAACSSANAVTITFDAGTFDAGIKTKKTYSEAGFQLNKSSKSSIVTSNCLSGSCLSLKEEQSSTLALISGSQFKLTDFWFKLLDEEASLIVDAYNGGNLLHHLVIQSNADDDDHHSNQSMVSLFSLLPDYQAWSNLTRIAFSVGDDGGARIDNIVLSTSNGANPSPVPVPGALPLLLTGIFGIGLLGRRRKRAI